MFEYGNVQNSRSPGPQTSIQVYSFTEQKYMPVDAIVDTGAVMTCVPVYLIDSLGENLRYRWRRVSTATTKQDVKSYYLNFKIFDLEFDDLEVLALPREYALIGRDILNDWRIRLDGPDRIWRMIYDLL